MRRKIVLNDVRNAVEAVRRSFLYFNPRYFPQMSDEDFMRCRFSYDFGMDSMDFEEFCCQIESDCSIDINVQIRDRFNDNPYDQGLTVAAFITACNRRGS
jgi:hypothetical protein